MKIKILQIGMTKNIGGMETYIIEQYRHINHNIISYDFMNITGENQMVFQEEIERNGDIVYSVPSRHINPIKHWLKWLSFMYNNASKYEGIVLNTCDQSVGWPLFLAKVFKIPKRIVHSHNAGNEVKSSLFRRLLYKINQFIWDYSITERWACSKEAGQWMFGSKAFTIIRNAIDINKFTYNPDMRIKIRNDLNINNKLVVGHVGRVSYQKNHEFLLDIFYVLHQKNKESVLLLVGDTDFDEVQSKKLKEKISQYSLNDSVILLGMRNDIENIMQAMDCFVLPSFFEGLALVGVEAQCAGLPCFFSDTITRDISMSQLSTFISLDQKADYWADSILNKMINITRNDMSEDILQAGYSISSEAKRVESLYLKQDR